MTENPPEPKKNKSFFLLSVILLAVVAAVILFFFKKNKNAEMTDPGRGQQAEEMGAGQDRGNQVFDMKDNDGKDLTFANLMQRKNGSYVCQLENEEGTYTYYFNDDQMMIDIDATDSHFVTLMKKDFTYNWDSDRKMGTKMASFTEDDAAAYQDEMAQYEAGDEDYIDSEMDEAEEVEEDYDFDPANFKCQAWKYEADKFTPPSDVVFQDMSDLQEQMINAFEQ